MSDDESDDSVINESDGEAEDVEESPEDKKPETNEIKLVAPENRVTSHMLHKTEFA
jgi:hypothetical protein